MKVLIFLSVFLFILNDLFPSQDSINCMMGADDVLLGQFSKAKLITKDYKKIAVSDVRLYMNKVTYMDFQTKKPKNVPLNDVLLISASKGTFWLEGTLLGGLGGLMIPVLAALNGHEINGEAYVYATLGGSLIGLLVGASISNYKTVYQSGDFFLSYLNNNNSLYPNLSFNNLTVFKIQILIN